MDTFWNHAAELRKTLLYMLSSILLGTVLCFIFYSQIFAFLTQPLQKKDSLDRHTITHERLFNKTSQAIIFTPPNQPTYLSEGTKSFNNESYLIPPGSYLDIEIQNPKALFILSPLEGMSTAFKVCFWLGVVISSPAWGYALIRFLIPALKKRERQLIFPFLTLSALFIALGFFSAYKVTLPVANRYLEAFNSTLGVNFWTLSTYLDYTFFLLLANGFAYEIGLILLFLVHLKILSVETLVAKRKPMIVLAFVLGALLTPPEIVTQLMLAIPLIILYELTILYGRFIRIKG